MKRKSYSFILSFVVMVLLAVTVLVGCNDNSNANTNETTPVSTTADTQADMPEIGEGKTSFVLEVTDDQGNKQVWQVHTDAPTVGEALLELGMIAGDPSDFGLMITEVNGVTADWDADNAFWGFYVDGEFATTGADSTEIVPGTTYAFVYSQG